MAAVIQRGIYVQTVEWDVVRGTASSEKLTCAMDRYYTTAAVAGCVAGTHSSAMPGELLQLFGRAVGYLDRKRVLYEYSSYAYRESIYGYYIMTY